MVSTRSQNSDQDGVTTAAGLEDVLEALKDFSRRMDSLQERIEKQEKSLHVLSESGLLNHVVNSSNVVADACGLDGEKMYGRKTASLQKKKKQALGSRIYTFYCILFAILMFLSFEKRIPDFEFERKRDFYTIEDAFVTVAYMNENMYMPFLFSFVYVVVVFGIQSYMKEKKAYDLRTPLALWSLSIGLFSLFGSLRTVPVVFELIEKKGLRESMCGNTYRDWTLNTRAGFWTYLFVLSKVPELIDTVFIVLRKRTLITLHWYHHITVLTFCWHSWATGCLNGIFYAAMNLTVHAFMYIFYFLAALGYRPTAYAKYITIMQISQMIFGTAITLYVNYHMKFIHPRPYALNMDYAFDYLNEESYEGMCHVQPTNALAGLLMYSSYLYLFCVFFYQAYLAPKKKKE